MSDMGQILGNGAQVAGDSNFSAGGFHMRSSYVAEVSSKEVGI